MRIFIDVGAHYGETMDVALDPAWGFDQLHMLEPASACQPALRAIKDPRIVIHPVAISDHDGTATIYGAGLLGGSLYADKRQIASEVEKVEQEQITLVKARDWFAENIPANAEVFLKLNCEGSECDILDDLIAAGLIGRISSMYVDFDVRKVESQAGRQEATEAALKANGIRYVSSDELGVGQNEAVARWLSRDCPKVTAPLGKRLSYGLKLYASPYEQARALVGAILPRQVFWWIGRRFGRLARGKR